MKNRTIFVLLLILFSLTGNKIYSSTKVELSLDGIMKHVTGCYGDKNAYIKLHGVGGTPSYIYTINNWQTSQATGDFINLDIGTYTVKVRDAANDEAEMTIEITQPTEFKLTGEKTNVSDCFGNENGTISLTGKGGIAPYYFSINNGNNFFTEGNFTELAADFYKIIGKDKNNCQKSFNLYIEQPEQITITTVWTNDVTPCYGDNNGTATISSSGGTGSHTYSIDGTNYQTEDYFENISADIFVAQVKDENNCTSERNFTISQPDLLIANNAISSDLSCYNSNDGRIEIQANGGTAPLHFTINQTDYFSTSIFENLSAGNYSAEVKDNNGCKISQNVTLLQEDELIISENHINVKCNNQNTASITLNASGGAGNYSYSNNSGLNYQTENIFSSLSAKTYNLIVKDKDNCTKNIELEIIEPAALVFDSVIYNHSRCNGDSDAKISIYSKGGTGTLFYSINSGTNLQNSSVFENLQAGYYPILVQDENACKITSSATINEPIFEISYNKTDVDCSGNANGSIGFSTYGSNPPFHFSIDNGDNFQEVTMFINLSENIYNYVIKDQINCLKTGTFEILEPEPLLINEEINSGCNNGDGATVILNAQGGESPIQYSINNGLDYQSENLFSGLNIGNYSLKILDDNACSVSKNITIENPDLLNVSTNIEDLLCYNDFSGSFEFGVSGGVLPYSFSINNGINFQEEAIFTELQANNYSVIIKDKNNCQENLNLRINQPNNLTVNIQTIQHITSCYGDENGSFTLTSLGGTGEILYSLDNGSYENLTSFIDLSAKDYLINAKDANNCVTSLNLTINQPELLVINEITKTDVTDCFGFSSGSIYIQANGGSLPLVYSINNGETYHNNSFFENLNSGDYNLSVRDASQCLVSSSTAISQPTELIVEYTKTDISCFGEKDGFIEISASGGTGITEYSINNGAVFFTNFSFDLLEKGNYNLICKDANNCRILPIGLNIIEPTNLIFATIKSTDLLCDKINGGIISVQANGGTGTLLYSIDNSAGQIDGLFENLSAGTHTITVEDDNNCTHQTTVELRKSDASCIEIPTAFTPNEDGINDTWEIPHLDLYPEAWVQIYDCFGNTITRYKSGETGWNGNFNQNKMPMASYWYRIQLVKDSEILKGYFSLIR